MKKLLLLSFVCVGVSVLSGCTSGVKPYCSTQMKNVEVSTTSHNVEVAVDVFDIQKGCEKVYQGSVELNNSPARISLPTDKPHYLVFAFISSRYLGSDKRTATESYFLTPQSGRSYSVDVRYEDDIYDVAVNELRNGQIIKRRLPSQPPAECRY